MSLHRPNITVFVLFSNFWAGCITSDLESLTKSTKQLTNSSTLENQMIDKIYVGFCRCDQCGRNNRSVISSYRTENDSQCQQGCQVSKDCTAFAFEPINVKKNCNLYRGGPYTYGSGKEDTICYVTHKGNL